MTLWHAILIASIIVLGTKVLGHALPTRLFERPTPRRTLELLTVSLLAGLIAVQSLGAGQAIAIDARLPAVGVAVVLFWLRVPFIVVIVVVALVAALLRRLLGWP